MSGSHSSYLVAICLFSSSILNGVSFLRRSDTLLISSHQLGSNLGVTKAMRAERWPDYLRLQRDGANHTRVLRYTISNPPEKRTVLQGDC